MAHEHLARGLETPPPSPPRRPPRRSPWAAAAAIGALILVGVDLLPASTMAIVVVELNGAVEFDRDYSLPGTDVYAEIANALGLVPAAACSGHVAQGAWAARPPLSLPFACPAHPCDVRELILGECEFERFQRRLVVGNPALLDRAQAEGGRCELARDRVVGCAGRGVDGCCG